MLAMGYVVSCPNLINWKLIFNILSKTLFNTTKYRMHSLFLWFSKSEICFSLVAHIFQEAFCVIHTVCNIKPIILSKLSYWVSKINAVVAQEESTVVIWWHHAKSSPDVDSLKASLHHRFRSIVRLRHLLNVPRHRIQLTGGPYQPFLNSCPIGTLYSINIQSAVHLMPFNNISDEREKQLLTSCTVFTYIL